MRGLNNRQLKIISGSRKGNAAQENACAGADPAKERGGPACSMDPGQFWNGKLGWTGWSNPSLNLRWMNKGLDTSRSLQMSNKLIAGPHPQTESTCYSDWLPLASWFWSAYLFGQYADLRIPISVVSFKIILRLPPNFYPANIKRLIEVSWFVFCCLFLLSPRPPHPGLA